MRRMNDLNRHSDGASEATSDGLAPGIANTLRAPAHAGCYGLVATYSGVVGDVSGRQARCRSLRSTQRRHIRRRSPKR